MNLGSLAIDTFKLGANQADKIMLGTSEVWRDGIGLPTGENLALLQDLSNSSYMNASVLRENLCVVTALRDPEVTGIDITDPTNMLVLSTEDLSSEAVNIFADGESDCLSVARAANLTAVTVVDTNLTVGVDYNLSVIGIDGVQTNNGYYVISSIGGCIILDTDKVQVGAFQSLPSFESHLCTVDNIVWGSSFNRINSVDVSDPVAPIIGSYHQVATTITSLFLSDNNILFVAYDFGIEQYDVSIPSSAPILLGGVSTGLTDDHGITVVGDIAFIRSGQVLMSYNIADPTNMTLIDTVTFVGDLGEVEIQLNPLIKGLTAFLLYERNFISVDIT